MTKLRSWSRSKPPTSTGSSRGPIRRGRSCWSSVRMPGWCASAPRRSIKSSVDDPSDPFSLARLDGDDLAGEPTRLVEEANTMPLFGGRRAVWVKAGARNFAPAVEALIAARRAGLPGGDRGRRSRAQRAAARAVRARQERGGAALLRRRRARPRPPHRRRDARGRPHDLAGGARRAGAAARRRSARLAPRDPQARAVCARQGARRARRRDGGGGRRLDARRSTA